MRKHKVKTSKYKYVRKKGDRFIVRIPVDGKLKQFGSFIDEDEAGRVALEKAKEYGKEI